MNIYNDIMNRISGKAVKTKIKSLESEIEELRELTTNNYWKLKKQIDSNVNKNRKRG